MADPLHFIVGTAGHIDHGKSTLIEALSGTDPDRLPEEKARGITIDLGFAHLPLPGEDGEPGFDLGLIDVPGHADFVKNMVAGVGSVDVALFVVAADDGWMPQSEEHLQILSYLGVRHAVVALTKADTVDDVEFSAATVAEELEGSVFEGAPIVPVCALIGDGIDALKGELSRLLRSLPPPADIGKPRLSVDRVFSPQGVGTVVTGTMTGGRFTKGAEVVVQPHGSKANLRGIQSHRSRVDTAVPGTRTALNLPDIGIRKGRQREGIGRGDVVTVAGLGTGSRRVHVRLSRDTRGATPGRDLEHALRVRFHHGAANVAARVLFFENRDLAAGEQAIAEIRLDRPVFTFAGDRFVLRDWSKRFTLAGGTVLDPAPRQRSYREPSQFGFLRAASGDGEVTAGALLAATLERDRAVAPAGLLAQSRFSAQEITRAVEGATGAGRAVLAGGWLIDGPWWEEIAGAAAGRVETIHEKHPELPGLDLSDLRTFMKKRLPEPKLFDAVVEGLCAHRGFVRAGTMLRSGDHAPKLPPALQAAGDTIRAALDATPLEPPNPKELAKTDADAKALKFLLETGEAVQLDEKAVLLAKHFRVAIDSVRAHIRQHGPSTAAALRETLGTTRRILIPLLERLDRDGVTLRQGDLRSLKG